MVKWSFFIHPFGTIHTVYIHIIYSVQSFDWQIELLQFQRGAKSARLSRAYICTYNETTLYALMPKSKSVFNCLHYLHQQLYNFIGDRFSTRESVRLNCIRKEELLVDCLIFSSLPYGGTFEGNSQRNHFLPQTLTGNPFSWHPERGSSSDELVWMAGSGFLSFEMSDVIWWSLSWNSATQRSKKMESILEGECIAMNWLRDNQSNHFIVFNTLREREHWKSTRSDIRWWSGIEFEDKTPYDVLIGKNEISSINLNFYFIFVHFWSCSLNSVGPRTPSIISRILFL